MRLSVVSVIATLFVVDGTTTTISGLTSIGANEVSSARGAVGRWVSAWGKCADSISIVEFLSKPDNTGAFKSLFMYDLVSIANGTVKWNDTHVSTCISNITALGVKVEPILHIPPSEWTSITGNNATRQRVGTGLVAASQRHGFYGYATDIEGVDKSRRVELLKLFRLIHESLSESGVRFAPFIDYSTVYDDWKLYIPVSDRILDGMCYKSESEAAFFKYCRASAKQNTTTPALHHLGAAFLSPAEPGRKGHWGYDAEGARIRVQAVIDAGSPEIGMFNLIDTAPWWPPLLKQFLANASVLPPPPPPPPIPQMPGNIIAMAKCDATNIRMQWIHNTSASSGGLIRPVVNMTLCLDASNGTVPLKPPLVLKPCNGAQQQHWSYNHTSGQIQCAFPTGNVCLDDNVGSIGKLGISRCMVSSNTKYQKFEISVDSVHGTMKRDDGFCVIVLNKTNSC